MRMAEKMASVVERQAIRDLRYKMLLNDISQRMCHYFSSVVFKRKLWRQCVDSVNVTITAANKRDQK